MSGDHCRDLRYRCESHRATIHVTIARAPKMSSSQSNNLAGILTSLLSRLGRNGKSAASEKAILEHKRFVQHRIEQALGFEAVSYIDRADILDSALTRET